MGNSFVVSSLAGAVFALSACGESASTAASAGSDGTAAGGSSSDSGAGETASTTAQGGAGSGQGGMGQGGAGGAPASQPNVAFVTSLTYTANVASTNVDALCQGLATAAGLPDGAYVAFVTTPTRTAAEALGNANGWVRTDGRPFAASADDLLSGRILNPLRLDETGTDVGQQQFVATGSLPNGTSSIADCNGWTSIEITDSHIAGDPAAGGEAWAYRLQTSCEDPVRFYCLQVDYDTLVAPEPVPAGARLIFTTTTPFAADGGLATADGTCAAEALAAGLSGTFVALLATDEASAASRAVEDERPWYRTDGVQVAKGGGLVGPGFNDLMAAPNVSADGGTHVFARTWSGDSDPSAPPGNNLTCASWTSLASPAVAGENGPTDGTWFSGVLTSCEDTTNHLRCVQQ